LKVGQTVAGSHTNPQLRIAHASFEVLQREAQHLVAVGPTLIEPTLNELKGGSGEPMLSVLIGNVQRLKPGVQVFVRIGRYFKSLDGLFGYLSVLLSLLAVAFFVLAARPVLTEIIKLPERAVSGDARVGRVVKDVFRRIGRDFLATLGV